MRASTGDDSENSPPPDRLDLRVGFTSVDEQPEPDRLVAGMEATAQWPAVIELRAFEREHLRLSQGDALLDVGCGLGDASMALSSDLMPGGRIVGIDVSESMLAVARERAAGLDCDVTFRVGDAMAIDEDDASFDACRSERVLQWLPDVDAAVTGMARVLRPGGRLSLIDTDWRMAQMDVADYDVSVAFMTALSALRGKPAAAGGLMFNACRRAGLVDLEVAAATHIITEWDPDADMHSTGVPPIPMLVDGVVHAGHLDQATGEQFLAEAVDRARRGEFWMALTMFAVSATKP